MEAIGYQKKYVAFIDILGFSELIELSSQQPSIVSDLYDIFSGFDELNKKIIERRIERGSNPLAEKSFLQLQGLKHQIFSDCIVMSANYNPMGLLSITALSAVFYWALFSRGIYARGSIVIGDIFHEGNFVFGPAMIEAYALESKIAVYPRLVLSDDMATDAHFGEKKIPRTVDFDGVNILSFFDETQKKLLSEWNGLMGDDIMSLDIPKGALLLREKIASENRPSVKVKLNWLKTVYNKNCVKLGYEPI